MAVGFGCWIMLRPHDSWLEEFRAREKGDSAYGYSVVLVCASRFAAL